jgi:hypothetical protein
MWCDDYQQSIGAPPPPLENGRQHDYVVRRIVQSIQNNVAGAINYGGRTGPIDECDLRQ